MVQGESMGGHPMVLLAEMGLLADWKVEASL